VDTVVRAWIWETTDSFQETIEGGSLETEVTAGFYADDGVLSSPDHEYLQDSLDHLVGLFGRVGIEHQYNKDQCVGSITQSQKVTPFHYSLQT
jgi:hypothetical protein